MARAKRKKSGATFGSRTDVGCVREHNEDSLAVAPPLYVVCDGMAATPPGKWRPKSPWTSSATAHRHTPDASALGQAVEEANLAIIRAAREGVGRASMGCTCTAAMLEKDKLVIAQVGDSRAYLLHKGQMQQLTRDHSLVPTYRAGQITEARPGVTPSARSSPALWAATRAPSRISSKSPWKPATVCFYAPMAFPRCWKTTRSPRSSPTTASPSVARLSW